MPERFENTFEQDSRYSAGYDTQPATPDGWDTKPRPLDIPESPIVNLRSDQTEVALGNAANVGDFDTPGSEL